MRKALLLAIALMGLSIGGAAEAQFRPCGQLSFCPPINVQGPIRFDDPSGPPHDPTAHVLPKGYAASEYFIAGATNVFNYNRQPGLSGAPPGSALVPRYIALPYKTRIYVVSPTDPAMFSGDVVIEFLNSSAGFDSAPQWLISSDYFARAGYVYIGVTTSANASIPFLKNGCHAIGPSCNSRYASLFMTDNGQEYEIVSQLVTALKSGRPSQIPLRTGFGPVKRVYVTGQSQQAGSVITHANQFSFPLVDGYFIGSNVHARALGGLGKASDLCGGTGAQPYPDCFATLPAGRDLIRTNLPMPVYHLMTETDLVIFNGALYRQKDADSGPRASYRLVEIPAVAHNVNVDIEILPGVRLKDLCVNDAYGITDPIQGYQVSNAMWLNMRRQVVNGVAPPHAPRIRTDSNHQIVRNSFGNAEGGVRMPELDAPTNSYFSPLNTGKPACGAPGAPPAPACAPPVLAPYTNLICFLSGSYKPLPRRDIHTLYSKHADYVHEIWRSAHALHQAGFLEQFEVQKHVDAAKASSVGK